MKFSGIKTTILGVGIAIILALFVGYGIATFYPGPKYEDYCVDRFAEPIRFTQISECETAIQANQPFEEDCWNQKGQVRYKLDNGSCRLAIECDLCSKEYRDQREGYDKIVFIITAIIGIIALFLGGVVLHLESVSSGIMGGGVLTIIYGTLRYWGNLPDIGRFLILGLVLMVLIWMGYKKFKS